MTDRAFLFLAALPVLVAGLAGLMALIIDRRDGLRTTGSAGGGALREFADKGPRRP